MIPPRIWLKVRRAPRSGVRAPTRTIPSDTAGLNRPPLTRKKIHALTASEKPNERAMYSLWVSASPWSLGRTELRTGSRCSQRWLGFHPVPPWSIPSH